MLCVLEPSDLQTIGKFHSHGSLIFALGRSTTLHICRTGVKEVLPESLRSRNITDISERLEPREPSTDLKLHPQFKKNLEIEKERISR